MEGRTTVGEDDPRQRVAIVVVHGVGEAESGETVVSLARQLERPGVVLDHHDKVVRLADQIPSRTEARRRPFSPPASGTTAPTFPIFIRRATVDDKAQVTIAELFWADLTRLGTSRLSSMLGLFRVIFEAHFVIDAMLAGRKNGLTQLLRTLLLWLSWAMRGPIAGLTASTVIVLWAALYARPLGQFGWPPLTLSAAAIASLLMIALILRVWTAMRHIPTWRTSLNWTLFMGVSVLVILGAVHTIPTVVKSAPWLAARWGSDSVMGLADRAFYINLLYVNLIRLWILWGALWVGAVGLLIVIGLVALATWGRQAKFKPPLVATGILTLQFALWTALVGTTVLPLISRAQELIGVYELQGPNVAGKVRSDVAGVAGQSDEVRRLLDVADFRKDDFRWISRLIFAYGFNGAIITVLILLGGLIYGIRFGLSRVVSRASPRALARAARFIPRLLFSPLVVVVLLAATFAQLVLHIIFSDRLAEFAQLVEAGLDLLPKTDLIDYLHGFYAKSFGDYVLFITSLAWALALVFPLLMGRSFNNVVHIAQDLIDHQCGPAQGRTVTSAGLKRLPLSERFPRRAHIRARLEKLLETLAEDHPYDHLVFVAHSQGSVVAYDLLADAACGEAKLGTAKVDVITFGSPLSYIYERYYDEYAGLGAQIKGMQACLGRWVNLYRIDDYVGTEIEAPAIENRPLGPGGHVDYWKEEALAGAILEMIRRSPATPELVRAAAV